MSNLPEADCFIHKIINTYLQKTSFGILFYILNFIYNLTLKTMLITDDKFLTIKFAGKIKSYKPSYVPEIQIFR